MEKQLRADVNKLTSLVAGIMAKPKQQRKRRKNSAQNEYLTGTTVEVPSAGGAIVRRTNRIPRFINSGESIRVANCEQRIAVTTLALGAFSSVRHFIVPGYLSWLTSVAANFSKWRWLKCRVVYIPTCNTTTTGNLTIGLNYDCADAQPADMIQAQSAYKAVSSPVWAGFNGIAALHHPTVPDGAVAIDVDVTRFESKFYRYATSTTIGALSSSDKNIYIPVSFDLSSAGGLAATVGNIFITYEVELIEPTAAAPNL